MNEFWDFNTGSDGFQFRDDAFRGTSKPAYANGIAATSGGYGGSGALRVDLGGIDDTDVLGMSGGWQTSFTLDAPQAVTLTFRVKMSQGANYESGEVSEVLAAIDNKLIGSGGRDYLYRISGDGAGGPDRSTGWKLVTVELGELAAGQHTLQLGGFNNAKTEKTEKTTIWFDDVSLKSDSSGGSGGGGTGGGTLDLAAFEQKVFDLTNAFRVANGKTALVNDAKLNAAAEGWSQSMANGDFFKHSTPAQVEAQGYDWKSWGENIAAGQKTPEAVVNGWINSPGHRANMLSDKFKEIGIGYHYLANDPGNLKYGHYWTQVFGTEANDTLI